MKKYIKLSCEAIVNKITCYNYLFFKCYNVVENYYFLCNEIFWLKINNKLSCLMVRKLFDNKIENLN